jgi:hypothetical protein
MRCLRRSFESIRVFVGGLRRYASVEGHASAFVFEPHDGGMPGEHLRRSARLAEPMLRLTDDRMVFHNSSDRHGCVPIAHAFFEFLQVRFAHAKILRFCSLKTNRSFVPALAGGNA